MFPLVLPQVIPKNELEKWLHDRIIFHSVPANREELIKVLKKHVTGGQSEVPGQGEETTPWDETLPDSDSETEHRDSSGGEGGGAAGNSGQGGERA